MLEAKTGKIVWKFYLVPKVEADPVRGPEGASPLDKSTWENAAGIPISGGGTWTSLTLDPDEEELFVPVGNPSPAFALNVRGASRLTASAGISYNKFLAKLPRVRAHNQPGRPSRSGLRGTVAAFSHDRSLRIVRLWRAADGESR